MASGEEVARTGGNPPGTGESSAGGRIPQSLPPFSCPAQVLLSVGMPMMAEPGDGKIDGWRSRGPASCAPSIQEGGCPGP